MKIGLSPVVLCLFVATAACGSSGDDAPTGPVSASPLTGEVGGKAFVGKAALARSSGSGDKRSIDIYETDASCATFGDKATRKILISVPWTAGTAKDFGFSLNGGQTATFVIDQGGTPRNIVATTGRVEVIEAPTGKGAKGKMRLRAVAGDEHVEGEIPVEVCE